MVVQYKIVVAQSMEASISNNQQEDVSQKREIRDMSILQSVENVLNSDIVIFVKDIVVALVVTIDVVVQKFNKDLFVVVNPIDEIGIESRSEDGIFVDMPLLESVHESEDLLQE